jgi:hypothetical protein
MKFLLYLLPLIIQTFVYGQQYTPISLNASSFTVNSKGGQLFSKFSMSNDKNTRRLIRLKIPQGMVSYAYRIVITSEGSGAAGQITNTLIDIAKQNPNKLVAAGAVITQAYINCTNSQAADIYLFDDLASANNFESKNDGNWMPCSSFLQYQMIAQTSNCYDDKYNNILIGIKNNNTQDAISVFLEVVAIVETNENGWTKKNKEDFNTNCINILNKSGFSNSNAQMQCSCMLPKYVNSFDYFKYKDLTPFESQVIMNEVLKICQEDNKDNWEDLKNILLSECVKATKSEKLDTDAKILALCNCQTNKIISTVPRSKLKELSDTGEFTTIIQNILLNCFKELGFSE